jgi:hypothetical protein
MIAALDVIPLATAHRQRELAVWTGIFEGYRCAVTLAVKHHRFIKKGDGIQLFA